jgi:hypothetical protein
MTGQEDWMTRQEDGTETRRDEDGDKTEDDDETKTRRDETMTRQDAIGTGDIEEWRLDRGETECNDARSGAEEERRGRSRRSESGSRREARSVRGIRDQTLTPPRDRCLPGTELVRMVLVHLYALEPFDVCWSCEGFGKKVRRIFASWNMVNIDEAAVDRIANEVGADVDVFHS